jgi:predicted nuclease with TOPRIM domain
MEKKVLTPEELTSLKDLKNKYNQVSLNLGRIEIEFISLSEDKEKLKTEFNNLKNQELNLVEQMKVKYGEGTISLETGEFLPKV